jgi:hypothetical protein
MIYFIFFFSAICSNIEDSKCHTFAKKILQSNLKILTFLLSFNQNKSLSLRVPSLNIDTHDSLGLIERYIKSHKDITTQAIIHKSTFGDSNNVKIKVITQAIPS